MKKNGIFALVMSAVMVLSMCSMLTGCGENDPVSQTTESIQTSDDLGDALDTGVTSDNSQISEDGQTGDDQNNGDAQQLLTEEPVTIRVGAMAGPTAMSLVKLMSDSDAGLTTNTYEFADLTNDASSLVAPIAKGELDIAAVPSNLASNIYNNTDGSIQVIAINALGVLNLVERGESISSISDLKGKSIYATGQGAVPEYIIRFILNGNGLNPDTDVNIIWCSDTTEALAYVSEVVDAIAILPQPFVTAASAKIESTKLEGEPSLRVVADLNDEWDKLNPGCSIVTGVLVVRKEFAEKYPQQLSIFIEEFKASAEYANTDVEGAAALTVNYGIVAAEGVAKNALPKCHIVSVTGEEMMTSVEGFLTILYNMEPKSVGGELPGRDFYYGVQ